MVDNLSSGVWGVVATPFLGPSLEVDGTSLSRLVKHYEGIGVTGLTVLGVFGEAARLSGEERRTVLEVVAASVELPLVVGVTGLATAPVIEEARQVREVVGDRLAGLMVQVNSPDPRVVAAHLNAVHDTTGAGIVVQDYPEASKVAIRTADLVRAVQAVPSTVGVKAEAPPTPAAVAVLTTQLDVPVFGGLGGLGLLDELAAGAMRRDDRFLLPGGPGRLRRRLAQRRIRRRPRGVPAVSAAGQLRGPGGNRTGRPQGGDPASRAGHGVRGEAMRPLPCRSRSSRNWSGTWGPPWPLCRRRCGDGSRNPWTYRCRRRLHRWPGPRGGRGARGRGGRSRRRRTAR